MQNFMMKSYAGLYCNDIENKIKNLLITIRTEQSIVGHVSRYSDRFQLVGVDCKRVEFNLLRGVCICASLLNLITQGCIV